MEKKRPYWQVVVSLTFSLLATAAFVIIIVRAIGIFMPFVVGWLISVLATPIVNWLERRLKIVKKFGSALIVILVLAIIVVGLYFGISRLVSELGAFMAHIPDLYGQMESGLQQIGDTLSGTFDRLPEGLQNGFVTLGSNLEQTGADFVSRISEPTVTAAGNFARSVTSYLISIIVAILSAYFFTVNREEILSFVKRVTPKPIATRMTLVMDNMRYAVGGYIKAQLKIMVVVFVLLCIGLAIVDVRFFILIAFLIAFLDFLPFLGTGIALGPWALYAFFMGNYKMAIVLIVTYVVTQLARHLLQPKLVADSVGMHPLLALILIYLGYRMNGFMGMILAVPLGMVVINMFKAGAFDYIINDVRILIKGIVSIRDDTKPTQ